jgi:2-amino-4-hydroxy-6-hydroxymethyldihydropteridine diphosphokinase
MQDALERLADDAHLAVLEVSSVYENRAVGMGPADPFLNAVVKVATDLEPLELLDRCLQVESRLGRVRSKDWTPRTIDLDVIAYADVVMQHARLQIPHPRIAERDFVVHPLCEIAPELVLDGRRVADLAAALPTDDLTLHAEKLSMPTNL